MWQTVNFGVKMITLALPDLSATEKTTHSENLERHQVHIWRFNNVFDNSLAFNQFLANINI